MADSTNIVFGKCALESCVYWTWAFGHTEPTATILVLLVLYHQIVFGGEELKALESLQWVPYAQIPMSNIHKRIRFVKPMVHWYQWYDWYQ